MDLVLFMDAISHCARIARIIQQPYGNALLVGVGGSGRRSLTELAVSISEMKLVQIEISKTYGMTEWRDDLKVLLRSAGEDGKDTVFLFADTQIKNEDFVEDINNILNTGEVPNLFESDERASICESLQRPAKEVGMDDPNTTELLAFFNKRTREHLHIILAFSPVGDAFRLVNIFFYFFLLSFVPSFFLLSLRSLSLSSLSHLPHLSHLSPTNSTPSGLASASSHHSSTALPLTGSWDGQRKL
jgi:hypothetical protein